ncbi:MAG: transposase [Gammaproteobacteria bacterium]|nr:transposase [Gammaproteobacteria bacterium]
MMRIDSIWLSKEPLVDELRKSLHQQTILHADETPVAMLKSANMKTHRAHVRAYTSTSFSELSTVVYDFAPGRSAEHAHNLILPIKARLQKMR